MSVAYQLPRSTRRSDYDAVEGQTIFGPTPWLGFDPEDVRVRAKVAGGRWATLTSGYTTFVLGPDYVVVTLAIGRVAGDKIRVEGARVHARVTDVTRAGAVNTAALERELDKMSTVLQEIRRDIDDVMTRSVQVPEGESGIDLLPVTERASGAQGYDALGRPVKLPINGVSIGVPDPGTVGPVQLAPNAVTSDAVDDGAILLAGLADNLAIVSFPNRATMAAYAPRKQSTATVWNEAGRNGMFIWSGANLATQVGTDPQAGIYVPPASDATGASGAWVRFNNTPGEYQPEWFGAVRGGVNDYAAIAATIAFAEMQATGTVALYNSYRIDTGLVLDTPLTAIVGKAGCRGASLYSPVANLNLITVSASQCEARNLTVYNNVRSTAQSALIKLLPGAVKCTFDSLDLTGGYYCIWASGYLTDTVFRNCSGSFAIGGAIGYFNGCGAVHFDRCLFNQGWPVVQPATDGSQDGGNWAAFQTYATGVFVRTGGFILQCVSGAGTTGATAPVLTGKWYFETITDGGHSWKIVNNSSACAVIVDSDCTYMRFRDCDFTGAFTTGFLTTNNFGTVPPHLITLTTCTTAGVIDNGFTFAAGKTIEVDDCEAQVILGSGALRAGFYVAPPFTGNINITRCKARDGLKVGVRLGNAGGGRVNVTGSQLIGALYGGLADAGVKDFSFTGRNVFAADGSASPTSIRVEAGGSDYYDISGNDLRGSSLPSDAGTGTNKRVQATVY